MTVEQARQLLDLIQRMDQRQQRVEDLLIRFVDAVDERMSLMQQALADIQDAIPEQIGGGA